ncbi:OprO/OprP family phosphate-selective porin [Alteromonas sp. C1M14]|uniref:OprO/OprP family phosphate-selective porin n=1 Tax=Alteromonas sp. C1M14 TaxID=2841567 RepID=UPI001C07FE0C|nr:OprO/OprP family phosphate-selective porin [Alteromonas sp. C1M14]MBU2976876.1 OprO/OprP family phosphate-selective porin [Alteromonas sp. C1M14]
MGSHSDGYADGYTVSSGDPGIAIESNDGNNAILIQGRIQFRYASPDDDQPVIKDDYLNDGETQLGVNRARIKAKGHGIKPWLKFSAEYDISSNTLLDYRIMIEKTDWLKFKVGQWKFEYSRERSISSGGQQMLDRSIINRHFTIDRQLGGAVYGHVDAGGMADFNYWAGVGTGSGRGAHSDDDHHPLYFARLQWNFLGKQVPFTASDLGFSQSPRASLGFSRAWNRSRYTRFSSAGGGVIAGMEEGTDGQYHIKQYAVDIAYRYQGVSSQGEYHEKEITDAATGERRTLRGYYVQAGYLAHQLIPQWPKALEIAARYAQYTPDSRTSVRQSEQALALNWFILGHDNKITADVTRFDYDDPLSTTLDKWRYRVQWDITF